MKITFKLRNEKDLHCRFCGEEYYSDSRNPAHIDLFETSPIKGIVCQHCRTHLISYVTEDISQKEQEFPILFRGEGFIIHVFKDRLQITNLADNSLWFDFVKEKDINNLIQAIDEYKNKSLLQKTLEEL